MSFGRWREERKRERGGSLTAAKEKVERRCSDGGGDSDADGGSGCGANGGGGGGGRRWKG